MAGRPDRFLLSSWPLRCLLYLVGSVAVGVGLLMGLVAGLLFPPVVVFLGLPVGALERRRLRVLDPVPVASPHATPPPGLGGWLRARLGEGATWRELGYVLALASVLLIGDLVSLGLLLNCLAVAAAPAIVAMGEPLVFGPFVADTRDEALVAMVLAVPATVVCLYALAALAGTQAAFARWLLAPRDAELNRRVEELARSRGRLVSAFEAERRRIERDLHDGAQQHLVLLSMTLGLARLELAPDQGGRAAALLDDAQRQARQALAAIRELIHGIHPQVLTDLGLPAAVGELAERCRLPVLVDLPLPRRLPAAVETTAYFVVCEALTNAVRHARASRVTVSGRVTGGRLTVAVTDDGAGGADPAGGTGLRGLADRAAVMDGTFAVTSPAGGPTTLRVDLPCALT
ncbi:sensor domain-containing protein [Dactylosporangium aurantiacum]|uniref:histidine kinase n=2 Tax=Dactylosporangium aurantiacum TaxID=35754 RepID=A0A9Q9IPV2_9ACTN|nr:sensor domain-containing protein [Dactylosporangium aurantiacum]